MVGLIIFAVASLPGGLAQNEEHAARRRALQGLGAALASPAALALITTTFPAGPARNRAFAVYAAMSGAGAAVGLILGGWLTGSSLELARHPRRRLAPDAADHHPDRPRRRRPRAPLLRGVREAHRPARRPRRLHRHPGPARPRLRPLPRRRPTAGATSGPSLSLAAGVALLAIFAFVESRVEHPLLPIRIFPNRTRAASFVAMMLLPAAMFSMFFFLSQYIQNVMGYSPLKAGFAFLPFCAGIIVARPPSRPTWSTGRPPLPRRHRHPDGVDRAVRVLPDPGRHRRAPIDPDLQA